MNKRLLQLLRPHVLSPVKAIRAYELLKDVKKDVRKAVTYENR